MKKALITGITGQDGSYLAELLLEKGYEVHGIIRRASTFNTERIDHLYQDPHINGVRLFLHYGDLVDSANLVKLVYEIQPDEIYNLAAQSHVRVSFDSPEFTGDVDALGTMRLLEAIHLTGRDKLTKFYQASTSELFGLVQEVPQKETTPFYPRSPYAVAKLYAYWAVRNYREAYGIFASNGILFNHESPRRGETFVTRKITRAVGRIKMGLQDKLYMGNINSLRDWGFAGDYVEGMWRIMQHDRPDEFVLATGEMHTVKEFLQRPRRSRLGEVRRVRQEVSPPDRGRPASRRRVEGEARAWLGAEGQVPRPRQDDGRVRPRARPQGKGDQGCLRPTRSSSRDIAAWWAPRASAL